MKRDPTTFREWMDRIHTDPEFRAEVEKRKPAATKTPVKRMEGPFYADRVYSQRSLGKTSDCPFPRAGCIGDSNARVCSIV